MTNTLLIIEDETLLASELARYFGKGGWEVSIAHSLQQAEQFLGGQSLDPLVVLSDMNLPDGNALDLLEKLKPEIGSSEWVFLTGYGSVADSVRAVRLGAYDFIEKPCSLDRLNLLVEGAARSARAQRRLEQQTATQNHQYSIDSLIGSSSAMTQLRAMLKQIANVPFSSLIVSGETGTGKGMIARILHYSGSRAAAPLVEINCAALPRELLEAELFGYEAGAFTGAKKRHRGLFEQAHTGTLFLDEIGEMDLDLQSKLLKAVEDLRIRRVGGEAEISIDVQIIAATNLDLVEKVAEGLFRRDLYHRLNVINIRMPALREHKQDLEQLVPQFVAECNRKSAKAVSHISEQAWQALKNYDWPGNIRELHNVLERCVLLSNDHNLPVEWLQLQAPQTAAAHHNAKVNQEGVFIPLDGSISLHEMEKFIIQEALNRNDDNVTGAARMLGTTRETLRYRVQKYHLKCKF
ncbi:sigma-54-dependent Fis family transcriptional regulator [Methylomonas methanica]|uniref:Sigma-54-dependent Fis family transcriptional regulator n=1 Tax=Methylomonas methanica TaxID=421 RepID=A0A177MV78_METMH|nr:sigma-54 dependent transcriptional regulator [Methylomonas methanica]OAI09627.1 sigma-54-dependent Fis family transcriptional regulator [Methylomonas methanica]